MTILTIIHIVIDKQGINTEVYTRTVKAVEEECEAILINVSGINGHTFHSLNTEFIESAL